MRHSQLPALTGIRGAAAVWVAVFHSYPLLGRIFAWPMRWQIAVVREGFLAVDLFFVLSGFVLSLAYYNQFRLGLRTTVWQFYFARICRIFPLHWVCLGILFLLVTAFPDHWWGPGPFTPEALIASIALVQNWTTSTALAWNHPTWSLSAEWLAYLAFPLLILCTRQVEARVWALLGALASLTVLGIYIWSGGSNTLDHVGVAGIARCLCEFSAGSLIWRAVWDIKTNRRLLGEACFGLGAALLVFAVAQNQLVAPFAFVMLVAGCALPSKAAGFVFGNPFIVFIGKISFSIYAVHTIILSSITLAVEQLSPLTETLPARIGVAFTIPAFILVTAYVLWRFVERPSQRLSRAFSQGVPARARHWHSGCRAGVVRTWGTAMGRARSLLNRRSPASRLGRKAADPDEPARS